MTGPTGWTGASVTGPTGITGPFGPLGYSEFYALMAPDNASTIGIGGAVAFPRTGATDGVTATWFGDTAVQLVVAGVYHVTWQVSVSEAAQLGLGLNGVLQPNTVVGRTTGTNQIFGSTIIQTASNGISLSVMSSSAAAITLTPSAGGTNAVTATLVIVRMR
jgi:hypothetical protein